MGRLRGLPRPLAGRDEDPGLGRRLTGDPAEAEVTGEDGAETRASGEGGVLKLLRDRPRPIEILDESDLLNEDLGPGTVEAVRGNRALSRVSRGSGLFMS